MKKYNYLLFDWDGCLAKTLELVLDVYRKTFAEYDIYPEDKTITHEVFGDWNSPKKLGIENIEEFTEKYTIRIDKDYPNVKLYEGARDTIEELKRREKKIALITTSKRSTLEPALKNTGLSNFFDAVLTAEDVKNHKPDPEMLHKAIELLDGNLNEALVIGDSKSDLGAARNTGIDSLLFYPESNKAFYDLDTLKTFDPTYIIYKFKDMLEILV